MPELKRYTISSQEMLYVRPNPSSGEWVKHSELELNRIHCNIVCEYCEGCVDLVPKENFICFMGRRLFHNN